MQFKTKYPCIFLCAKGLSSDDVGLPRDTVFQEIRRGAGFETGDFVKEKMGGAAVERFHSGVEEHRRGKKKKKRSTRIYVIAEVSRSCAKRHTSGTGSQRTYATGMLIPVCTYAIINNGIFLGSELNASSTGC